MSKKILISLLSSFVLTFAPLTVFKSFFSGDLPSHWLGYGLPRPILNFLCNNSECVASFDYMGLFVNFVFWFVFVLIFLYVFEKGRIVSFVSVLLLITLLLTIVDVKGWVWPKVHEVNKISWRSSDGSKAEFMVENGSKEFNCVFEHKVSFSGGYYLPPDVMDGRTGYHFVPDDPIIGPEKVKVTKILHSWAPFWYSTEGYRLYGCEVVNFP